MKFERPIDPSKLKLSMMIYGLTGSGKTHFCGTVQDCPAFSPTLVVNVAGGVNALAGKQIDVLSPKSLKDFQAILGLLFNRNKMPGQKYQYKSVCLDGITGVQQELAMPEVQGIRQAGMPDDYSNLEATTPPDRRDWLFAHEYSRRILRAMRDLSDANFPRSIHVIITALEKKDDARSIVCPDLPGKLGVECGAYMDILARLSIEQGEQDGKVVHFRKLWTLQRHNEEGFAVLAKNRRGILGSKMINPTMAKIYAKWLEGGKA